MIKELTKEEKPREKLIEKGPHTLSNAELLAIILRTGTKKQDVLSLSRMILQEFSIDMISQKTYEELTKYNGIKKAKACQIISCFELAKRLGTPNKNPKIKTTNDLYNYIKNDFIRENKEIVLGIFVNNKNYVIKKEKLFEGSIDYSIFDIRTIIKKCLDYNATGIFIAHNHFGDTTPSPQDIEITEELKQICSQLNIRLLDHLIICGNKKRSII